LLCLGIPGSRPFDGRLTAGSGAHPTYGFQVSVSLERLRLAPPPGLRCPGSSSIRRWASPSKSGHPVPTKNWQHKLPRAGSRIGGSPPPRENRLLPYRWNHELNLYAFSPNRRKGVSPFRRQAPPPRSPSASPLPAQRGRAFRRQCKRFKLNKVSIP